MDQLRTGMVKSAAPWLTRQTITGAGVGLLFGMVTALVLPSGAFLRALMVAVWILTGYLLGFAVAARRRLREATAYTLRLREELRLSQDHIMDTGSFRSLGAYLDATARGVKETAAALATEAHTLARRPDLDESVRPSVETVARRSAALATSLSPLAAYALVSPSRAPFNLNNLLREAIDLCRHRAEEKKILFEEHYGVIPPVFGPSGRLQSALLNVVINAVEAMPFGGGTIVVETQHHGDRVIGRMKDGGIGIRPEHLGRVFEPFFTTKPDKGSAGLGLWETKETLTLIGASIEVRSAPHQGTEVVMTFPAAAPMAAGRTGVAHPPELGRNTADEGDRQIA